MATGNQPARSPYGRAGFKPRHKQRRTSHPTACAGSVAQSSPCAARSSLQQANKRLMETYPNSDFRLTNWNHKHLTHPNSNSNPDSKRPSFSTACAGSVAQSSPCAARSSLQQAIKRPARQPSGGLTATVPKSKIESTDSKHAVYENSNRNKSADLLPLRLSTACAGSVAQPPPYGVDPRRELDLQLPNSNRQLETIRNGRNSPKIMQMTFSNRPKKHESLSTHHCNSNRSYCRLEINIPPIKQRTEALSNRSKSADLASLASGVRRGGIGVLRDQRESKDLSSVFWRLDAGSPPLKHWRAFGMPAVRRTRSRMKGGGGTNEKAPTEGPARCPPSKRLAGRSYFNAPRFWRDRFRTDRREPSS
jgi:hypothetical protein